MFTQFKQKLVARLTKFAYLIVPCGAVIPMMVTEIQEGYLVINAQNVYEVEHKRLYDVLFKNPNLTKGSDSKGNYVKLPDPNGRCIELTSNASFVGKLLQAMLPNITGKGDHAFYGEFISNPATKWSGALHGVDGETKNTSADWTRSFGAVGFDASRSSATYSGSKLQPSALQLLACIRC